MRPSLSERSARARFWEPLLCDVKMESLGTLEGRDRPLVVLEIEGAARREDRVEVKARLVGVVVGLAALGRGAP